MSKTLAALIFLTVRSLAAVAQEASNLSGDAAENPNRLKVSTPWVDAPAALPAADTVEGSPEGRVPATQRTQALDRLFPGG